MPKYFIAVLPPSSVAAEIIGFQKEIEELFGAKHAQKAPPHITVIPPFDCNLEKLQKLIRSIDNLINDKSIIDIHLKIDNFQRFEGRTLFADIAKNETFEKFCKELKLLFNQQKIIKQRVEKHYFVPHITIANKDIKKRDFQAAWTMFQDKKFQRDFTLQNLIVLELTDGAWKPFRTISL